MSDHKPFKKKYLVSFWGVRCFMDDDGMVVGVNFIYDMLIPVAIFFHDTMSLITGFFIPSWEQPGFPFKILEMYADQEGALNNE